MKLKVRPLTPNLWPALEDLFGENGACNGCWCMYWRIGAAYRKQAREVNKAAFRAVVKSGPPPGLLAFDGDLAVGWCQLTPRDALPWLDRAWRLRRVDAVPVWSISCFYIRKGYRKQGVTSALIAAALETAKKAGAPALEADPLDADLTPSASSTGYASTFARAGFRTVGRHTPPRPIMRRDLTTSHGRLHREVDSPRKPGSISPPSRHRRRGSLSPRMVGNGAEYLLGLPSDLRFRIHHWKLRPSRFQEAVDDFKPR